MTAATEAAPGMMTVQTFDSRRPVILDDPGDIKPGDWLEDVGTLRQVDYIDSIDTVFIVHFHVQAGVPHGVRGFSSGVKLTVFRELDHD